MRNTFLTLCLFLLSVVSFSQISSGNVKYDIDVESDNEMVASMMEDATMEIYFNKDNSKVKMDMVMMSNTIIFNGKTNQGLMLMDMMGSKIAVTMSSKEIEKAKEEDKDKPKPKVTFTKEKKKILGYKCKKAIVVDEEGGESIYWYTDKIKLNKTGQQNMNADIPGLSLMMIVENNGMLMTMTASEFNKEKVDKEEFDLTIPEGYEEMTMDELQETGL